MWHKALNFFLWFLEALSHIWDMSKITRYLPYSELLLPSTTLIVWECRVCKHLHYKAPSNSPSWNKPAASTSCTPLSANQSHNAILYNLKMWKLPSRDSTADGDDTTWQCLDLLLSLFYIRSSESDNKGWSKPVQPLNNNLWIIYNMNLL